MVNTDVHSLGVVLEILWTFRGWVGVYNSIICPFIISIAQFFKALCHQIKSLTFTEHLSAKFLKETFNLPEETTVPAVGLKGLLDQFRAK